MFRFSCGCDDCRKVRGWMADALVLILGLAVIGLVCAEIGIR